MEKTLEPIVLAALNRINTEVNLREQWQILNIFQLIDFLYVVKAHVQEFQTFNALKICQFCYLVFWQIQCSQNWQSLQTLNLMQLISTNEKFLKPKVVQIFNSLNLVTIKTQNSETLIGFNAINIRNIIVVKVEVFQILVFVGILNWHDKISRIVDPLKISWCIKIKSKLQLVVAGIELDKVFYGTKLLQWCQIISWNVNIL